MRTRSGARSPVAVTLVLLALTETLYRLFPVATIAHTTWGVLAQWRMGDRPPAKVRAAIG